MDDLVKKLGRIDERVDAIQQWQATHEMNDYNEFSSIRESLSLRPTKDDLKPIINEALTEFFKGYGRVGKSTVVTIAVIIGSIAVIGGGVKWLLGLFGFAVLMK